MFDRFRQRSLELEHLDKGDYTAEEYEGCIAELQLVNRWLGDERALRQSLLARLERDNLPRFSIVDVGAGSGELLQVVAEWSCNHDRECQLVGVELNKRSAEAIVERRKNFPEISAIIADGFRLPFADHRFDYAMCSLFAHHFQDEDVVKILRELDRVATRGIVVIDLHRNPVPYFFYRNIASWFLKNRLIREDGALSILRGFKPAELRELAAQAGLKNVMVMRSFPYRLVLTT